MIFGLKNQPVEIKPLLNDDEKTPYSMIGLKMVPILEYESKQFMPESIDIINFIDKKHPPRQVQNSENSKLLDWISKNNGTCYQLAMPRWVKAPLEEFKTQSARDYFESKKTAYIGSFKDCLKESPALIDKMEEELELLESFFEKQHSFFENQLSLNDFHLFAFLRSLSLVKGLAFPKKVNFYMKEMSKASQVPLHTDIAL